MSNILTLVDPKVMGEKHPTYGYSVWSETDGDYPVMFNVMDEKSLMPHVRVTYEEALLKTSSKGKEYLRLKKVKFEDNPVAKADVVPFTQKPEPTFNKSEPSKAFLKDLSDYPVRLYNGSLHYAKEAGLNLLETEDRRIYLEYIKEICNELLSYSDKIRSGQGETEPHPQSSPTPSAKEPEKAAAGSLRSAWEERKDLPKAVHWAEDEPPYTDQDMPEDM